MALALQDLMQANGRKKFNKIKGFYMGKMITTVAAVGALAIIGYSGYWYYQASEIKTDLASHVEQLNSKDGQKFYLQNQGIEQSGFPGDIKISMKNPKFGVKDESQKELEFLNVDGSLSLGFNLGGKLKFQELNGMTKVLLPINPNGVPEEYKITGNTSIAYHNQNIPYKESFNAIFTPSMEKMEDFWISFLTNRGDLKLKDFSLAYPALSPKDIVSIKDGNIAYGRSHTEKGDQKIHLKANLKQIDVSLPKPSIEKLDSDTIARALNYSIYSKMGSLNYAFNLTCEMPDFARIKGYISNPFSLMTGIFPTFNITLKDSDASSNLGKSSGYMSLDIREDDKQNITYTFDSDVNSNLSREYYEAIVSTIAWLSKDLASLKPANDDQKKAQDLFVNHAKELQDVVPKLGLIGPIAFAYKGAISINKSNFTSKIEFEKFDMSSEYYDVKIRSKIDGHKLVFNGTTTIAMTNIESLVADAVSYSNRVFKIFNILDSKQNLKEITPALKDKVISFLRMISDEPEKTSKDLQITIIHKDSNVTVGQLPFEKFEAAARTLANGIMHEV